MRILLALVITLAFAVILTGCDSGAYHCASSWSEATDKEESEMMCPRGDRRRNGSS